jgi:hypothetical protein
MKKFSVSLKILTKKASVKELSRLSGLQLSASSQDMGELNGVGRPFVTTVGVFEVESSTGDLNAQIRRLLEKLDFAKLDDVRNKLSDVTMAVDICVFFSTVTCSLSILPEPAEILGRHNIAVDVSCYPTSESAS